MFFLLGGQHVPGLPLCGCGGGHRLLVGGLLAPLQPARVYPQALGKPPVSASLMLNNIKEKRRITIEQL